MGVPDKKRASARNESAGDSTEPRLPTIARSLSRRIAEKPDLSRSIAEKPDLSRRIAEKHQKGGASPNSRTEAVFHAIGNKNAGNAQ